MRKGDDRSKLLMIDRHMDGVRVSAAVVPKLRGSHRKNDLESRDSSH